MTFRTLRTRLAVALACVIGLGNLPMSLAIATPFTTVLQAQATVNSTTLAQAVAVTDTSVRVTSASTIAAGQLLFVDREAMLVQSVSGTAVAVQRGVSGTVATAHASGAVIYSGPQNYFRQSEVAGPCTASSEVSLPRIVITSGNVYQCSNSEWVLYRRGGLRDFSAGRSDGGTTYTAAGAIAIQPGVSFINGTTLAMTLANPTKEQNGMIMIISSTNASAHTVTYTAGFNGGTTARDVATFGGAIGDNLVIVAFNEVWWVVSTRNVTIA